ncbi:uncharacterized protein LOC113312343 [Papaver somniferum]|uniref:uncharacterized protein LOC113312343 n=1 Tax=Papaver somniferum TaxID=3469 RepID=UPI000E7021FC|nr:uncharacterized protein LOC113312343 [Papaver somniferum]
MTILNPQVNENPRKKIRLTKEQKENERAGARLYTIIKVSRDEDFCEQIGRDIYFDLVDHDKVRSFRIQKQMSFKLFKEEVAKELGVPVQFQRFWLWAKRQNQSYRLNRLLTFQEETKSVGKLREELKTAQNAELNLFLEVNNYHGAVIVFRYENQFLDYGPCIVQCFHLCALQGLHPIPPPDITQQDVLLFFKLYDAQKEKLRYVGRLFVKDSGKPAEILKKLNEMAGFSPDEKIELYEEIKFEPTVMCEHIEKEFTFHHSQLENGDIICFQKPPPADSLTRCRYPDVPSFLEYILNRWVVRFQSLEKPKKDDFVLELSKVLTYDNVTERIAQHLGLDDPTKIRLTLRNCYSQQPIVQAIKYQGFHHLSEILSYRNQISNILYYEVLDIPLPVLQGLKTLNVSFHHAEKDTVIHKIRLPNTSTVGDVLNDLKTKVELSHTELRLLKVFNHMIFKVFPLSEKIENIKAQYFTLRAEEILLEEKNLGPQDCLVHVHHFTKDASDPQKVKNFGKPFLLIIREGHTLAEVKLGIQKKLNAPDEEFTKWKFAILSLGQPDYLSDMDIVSNRFLRRDICGASDQYLGLEHSDSFQVWCTLQFQRFWLWAKRQNHTYRPNRPSMPREETQYVGQLREVSDKDNAELKLYLEIELGPESHPIPPPDRTKEDILLFFKLYDAEKEELLYVGRLFVKGSGKPLEILKKLNEMAGFSPDEELYEEIKFEPTVMCEHIDKKLTFRASLLENGDIICFQKPASVDSITLCRYPDVPSFLEYVHNRQFVHFLSLEKPKEDDFCLELSKVLTYDDVTERVARHLGLEDPTKIRLTPHNCCSQQPKPQAIKYQGVDQLSEMLVHYNQTSDILYYEVLDIPLPELQGSKTLKVAFHHATKEDTVVHSIRLPKQSTVGDVINDLKTKVELSHPDAELRLLEVFYHKIYKIFPLSEMIENINDQYWTLRAEEIPEEEMNLGPRDRLIHVYHYHFTKDASQSQMVQNFGEPFLFIIHERETLGAVKLRIQKKLQVPDEWKFAFISLGRPEYLQDSDIVSSRFQRRDVFGVWEQYLGLEHSDSPWKRGYPTNQRKAAELIGLRPYNTEGPKGPTPDEIEVFASGDISSLLNYPTAGQYFLPEEHHQGVLDEKYEDIGGFCVLKAQAPLYRKIWLRYGHIATNQVLKDLYSTQVTLVTNIMALIMDMRISRFAEVSSTMIDLWENKISMAEKLEFKVSWLRERFQDVKKDFYGKKNLNIELLEKSQSFQAAKDELKKAQENVWSLKSRIRLLHKEKLMYSDKDRSLLLQGLV